MHLARVKAIAASVVLAAVPAAASTVTFMDTAELVRRSAVVVLGEVESVRTVGDAARGDLRTEITVRIAEALKGAAGRTRVTLVQPGGEVDGRRLTVVGAPVFREGERVLVFAQRNPAGDLVVAGLFQGKYQIEVRDGVELAERGGAGGARVLGRAGRAEAIPRPATPETARSSAGSPTASTSSRTRTLADRSPPWAGSTPSPAPASSLAHELGHVIGLGHSCGDSFTPPCSTDPEAADALMAAFAHGDGRGPTPQSGDIDGARFIYPTAAFIDAILNQDTFTGPQTLALRADFNGTALADLYIIIVLPDMSFFSLGAPAPNTLVPAASNVPLGFAIDVPLFSTTLTGSEPLGQYLWLLGLVRAGTSPAVTANWLAADVAPFMVQ